MSGGGKLRADAKLMQKPANLTKPLQTLERVKGIEPSSQAWEARILPLNHTRFRCASARQARVEPDNFYQTSIQLATGLRGRQDSTTSCLMASRKRASIKSWRSADNTLPPSGSHT